MTGSGAKFSPCRRYRYSLWRNWYGLLPKSGGYAMFIGLNPSTATETEDDPTVRRCINFAKSWGYDGLIMTNIFAYRATNPKDMMAQSEPVGEENDQALIDLSKKAGVVVAAWGTHGKYLGRGNEVRSMLPGLHYLSLTKDRYPSHPLYLPKNLYPVLWEN